MTPTASPAAIMVAALLMLAACVQQTPPQLAADPPQPVAKRVTPAPPRPRTRPRPAPQDDAARAERAARDREAQTACAYQGSFVEDQFQDQDQSPLGLDGVLAGQSARNACLRSYQQTGQIPGIAP